MTVMAQAEIITLKPDCQICGQRMEAKFLRRWSGRRVCPVCIDDLTREEDFDVQYRESGRVGAAQS